jgi:hypothetical protein
MFVEVDLKVSDVRDLVERFKVEVLDEVLVCEETTDEALHLMLTCELTAARHEELVALLPSIGVAGESLIAAPGNPLELIAGDLALSERHVCEAGDDEPVDAVVVSVGQVSDVIGVISEHAAEDLVDDHASDLSILAFDFAQGDVFAVESLKVDDVQVASLHHMPIVLIEDLLFVVFVKEVPS